MPLLGWCGHRVAVDAVTHPMRKCWLVVSTLLATMLRATGMRAVAWRAKPPLRALAAASRTPLFRGRMMASSGSGKSLPERVRQAAKLSEVIEDSGVDVVHTGQAIKARCPFHKGGMERTPSMCVCQVPFVAARAGVPSRARCVRAHHAWTHTMNAILTGSLPRAVAGGAGWARRRVGHAYANRTNQSIAHSSRSSPPLPQDCQRRDRLVPVLCV